MWASRRTSVSERLPVVPVKRPKTGPPHNVRIAEIRGVRNSFKDRSLAVVNVHAHVVNLRGWPRRTRRVHYFEVPTDPAECLQLLQCRFGRKAVVLPFTDELVAAGTDSGAPATMSIGQKIDELFHINKNPHTPRKFNAYEHGKIDAILQQGQALCSRLRPVVEGAHFLIIFLGGHKAAVPRRTMQMLRGHDPKQSPERCKQILRPTSSPHLSRYLRRRREEGLINPRAEPECFNTYPCPKSNNVGEYPDSGIQPLRIGNSLRLRRRK